MGPNALKMEGGIGGLSLETSVSVSDLTTSESADKEVQMGGSKFVLFNFQRFCHLISKKGEQEMKKQTVKRTVVTQTLIAF